LEIKRKVMEVTGSNVKAKEEAMEEKIWHGPDPSTAGSDYKNNLPEPWNSARSADQTPC
jgi:hypothetical protein